MRQSLRPLAALLACVTLLTGCAPSTPAASAPTPTAAAPTAQLPTSFPTAPPPTAPPPTTLPTELPATEPPATDTAVPAAQPTAAPLPSGQGSEVLRLVPGNGEKQVGIAVEGSTVTGPRSFRIGADGSIRVLDTLNKRLLFYTSEGRFSHAVALGEAKLPADFIVNNSGEIFVLDSEGKQVLRYAASGKLAGSIAISAAAALSSDGIMLDSNQNLLLTQGNYEFWPVIFGGEPVPLKLQTLAKQQGAVTPRSPVAFELDQSDPASPLLRIRNFGDDIPGEITQVPVAVPLNARFANVDRAMNLYFASEADDSSYVEVRRFDPEGAIQGGAKLDITECNANWRSYYVDQAGSAWTMCSRADGVSITRYALLDAAGQPLPEAPSEAANVAWKPGGQFVAA